MYPICKLRLYLKTPPVKEHVDSYIKEINPSFVVEERYDEQLDETSLWE